MKKIKNKMKISPLLWCLLLVSLSRHKAFEKIIININKWITPRKCADLRWMYVRHLLIIHAADAPCCRSLPWLRSVSAVTPPLVVLPSTHVVRLTAFPTTHIGLRVHRRAAHRHHASSPRPCWKPHRGGIESGVPQGDMETSHAIIAGDVARFLKAWFSNS